MDAQRYNALAKCEIFKFDILEDGKVVSTVLLPPTYGSSDLPYETMVFQSVGNFSDLACERYATREEAEAGHDVIVAEWSKKQEK